MFTRNVILIFADVGGVAHLTGGGDVTHHAFSADLEPLAFVMKCAAVNSGQYDFGVGLVVQIDVSFDASERTGDIIHNLVDELIQVED